MEQKSERTEKAERNDGKKDVGATVILALLFITSLLVLVNSVRLFGITANVIAKGGTGSISGNVVADQTQVLADGVLPKGIPAIYGAELKVSYDDISASNPQKADATIRKLAQYDVEIQLDGEKLQRYINIGSSISCEYCCGAESIIFADGQAACGCAHSFAMRGLAKYLLTEHPEMADEQILEEMGKWKVLFFPEIHAQKAAVLKSKGVELNYINLASNKYRGIEQGATQGGMVGGC